MSKPTNLAAWGATATKVEPSTGVKSAGWAPNQRPPAQWFNWWMNAVALWMVWLDAFESTAHSWTANQTWSGGAEIIAEDAIFSGEVDITTLFVSGTSTFGNSIFGFSTFSNGVLIQTTIMNVTAAAHFSGITTIDTLIAGAVTVEGNVLIDGGNFDGGNGTWTLPQVDFTNGDNIPTVNAHNTGGAGTGAPAGWFKNNDNTQPALVAEATSLSNIAFRAKGDIELQANIPGGGVPVKDKVTKLSIAKVIAKLKCNATATPDVDKELNLTSVTQAAGGNITLTFAQDFVDGDYVVHVGGNNVTQWNYECISRTVGTAVIQIWAIGGAQVDRATSVNAEIDFIALGDQ